MYLEKEEMKFSVVYAIKQYKAPINMDLTYRIFTWDKEIMQYFDLAEVLAELLEDGYIVKKFYRNEEAFCLTESGEEAYRFFKTRVPYSVRQKIDDAIGRVKYDEIVDPDAVKAEVIPVTSDQYMARCSILENKVPIMELNLNMGKRRDAERVARHFKENSQKIYEEILKVCTEDKA